MATGQKGSVRSKGAKEPSTDTDKGQDDIAAGETTEHDKSPGPIDADAESWSSFHKVWQHNIKDMSDEDPAEVTSDLFTDPLVILPTEMLSNLKEFLDDPENTMYGVRRIKAITEHPVMFDIFEEWRQEHYPDEKKFGDRPKKHIRQHCLFLQEMMAGAHEHA